MSVWLDPLLKYGFSVAVAAFLLWQMAPALDRLTRAITLAIMALKRLDKDDPIKEQAAHILEETPRRRGRSGSRRGSATRNDDDDDDDDDEK